MTDVMLVEVSPRDGLQNEKRFIPTAAKIELIKALSETGLTCIEATSFVASAKVPQFSDASELFPQLPTNTQISYPVLVPNQIGFKKARDAGANRLHLFTSASESFNQKNIGASVAKSLERFEPIFEQAAKTPIIIRTYLSCCFGCPYEGSIPFKKTLALALKLKRAGTHEIAIGDTLGTGTPSTVTRLLKDLLAEIPPEGLSLHLHDTYGQALTNIYASLDLGLRTFDSSLAGLGGCPYAKGATGNVATEEVVYLLESLGLNTGIDLRRLSKIGRTFCDTHHLNHTSRVGNIFSQ